MSGAHGVKETKEALLALVILGKFVADRLKDGVSFDDAVALAGALGVDGEFKSKVMAGVAGAEKIPAEVGEIDLADGLELAKVLPEMLSVLSA